MSKPMSYNADYLRVIITDGLNGAPVMLDAEPLLDEHDAAVIEIAQGGSDTESQSPHDVFLSHNRDSEPPTESVQSKSFSTHTSFDNIASDTAIKGNKVKAGIKASEGNKVKADIKAVEGNVPPLKMVKSTMGNAPQSKKNSGKVRKKNNSLSLNSGKIRKASEHNHVEKIRVETLREAVGETAKPFCLETKSVTADDGQKRRAGRLESKTDTQAQSFQIKPNEASDLRSLKPSLREKVIESTKRVTQKRATQLPKHPRSRNQQSATREQAISQVKIGRVDITVAARKLPQTVKTPKSDSATQSQQSRNTELAKRAALSYRRRL